MTDVHAGRTATAISQLMVQTLTEYVGRGPTSVRTEIDRDSITVILDEALTKAERQLVIAGHGDQVLVMRRSFQQVMCEDLVAGVERITGRTVRAFLSDNHIDPDIAVEVFVLEPA